MLALFIVAHLFIKTAVRGVACARPLANSKQSERNVERVWRSAYLAPANGLARVSPKVTHNALVG